MPLSDKEQQILDEIERSLYNDDPKFARGVATKTLRGRYGQIARIGVVLFVVGAMILVWFFVNPQIPIGVAAFLLMLVGATMTFHSIRKAGAEHIRSLKDQASKARFLGRFEEKLKDFRRRDQH